MDLEDYYGVVLCGVTVSVKSLIIYYPAVQSYVAIQPPFLVQPCTVFSGTLHSLYIYLQFISLHFSDIYSFLPLH